VLTAGLGTRLQPLSLVRAKPAVPIAGRPLIARILRGLADYGVRDVVLNLHHLPQTITALVGDGCEFGARVRYSWESPVLGSAGGPRKALPLLPDDDFFIINGDTLSDVDLHALATQHRESGAIVTMAVVDSRSLVERYGGVITDSRGIVYGFVPRGPTAAGYHFVGVQMAHPSAFARVPFGERAESTRDVYRALIAERRGSIGAFLAKGQFWDVGTPADYLDATLSVGAAEGVSSPQIGQHSRVAKGARLTSTVLWDDVEVGEGASLDRCVVADKVKIPAGATFRNCAIIQSGDNLVVADIVDG
jgi:NDP-sugar pyrophosphorylase family protein